MFKKKLGAVILAAALAISSMPVSAFADTVSTDAVVTALGESVSSGSENSADTEQLVESASGSETESKTVSTVFEDGTATTVEGDTTAGESASQTGTVSTESTSENEAEATVSENETISENEAGETETVSENDAESVSENEFEPGYKERKVLEEFENLDPDEAGVTYDPNTIVAVTDNKKEAEEVAEGFGGELVSFENGVAQIEITKETLDETPEEVIDTELFEAEEEEIEDLSTVELVTEIAQSQEIPEIVHANYKYEVEETSVPWDTTNYTGTVPEGGLIGRTFTDKKQQWYHSSSQLNTRAAWTKGNTRGAGVKVGIIDTGVVIDQEDLVGNIKKTWSYKTSSVQDYNGHGTHVAGIVGAEADNSLGYYGIAPEVDLYIYNVNENTSYNEKTKIYTANIAAALKEAVKDGVNVVNISLSSDTEDNTLKAAIKDAVASGVTVVVSAGNDGSSALKFPASMDETITVGNYDEYGYLQEDSNYGKGVTLAAPGTAIYSTYINTGNVTDKTAYNRLTGTSMAAPIVTGAVALIYATNPSYLTARNSATTAAVRKILVDNKTDTVYKMSGNENATVSGGLDIVSCVTKASSPAAPVVSASSLRGKTTINLSGTSSYCQVRYALDGTASRSSTLYTSGTSIEVTDAGSHYLNAMTVRTTDGQTVSMTKYEFNVLEGISASDVKLTKKSTESISSTLNPDNLKVKYYSSNTKVATVNSKGVVKGGSQTGKATIYSYQGKKTNVIKSTDVYNVVMGLKFPSSMSAADAQNRNVNSYAYIIGDQSFEKVTGEYFVSSNPSVADVDYSTGKLTINGNGSTTITGTFGDQTLKAKLKIVQPKINSTKKTVKVGQTFNLSVSKAAKTDAISWDVDNISLVNYTTVNRTKAKFSVLSSGGEGQYGTATVTAKVNGIAIGTCTLTINPPEPQRSYITVKQGKYFTLKFKNIKNSKSLSYSWPSASGVSLVKTGNYYGRYRATGSSGSEITIRPTVNGVCYGDVTVVIQ